MTLLELDGVFSTIAAPPAQAYRFGLFSVVVPPPEADAAWEGMGVTWVSQACTAPGVTYNPCIVDVVPALAADVFCVANELQPFVVYEMAEGTMRNRAATELNTKARLVEVEQFAVEAALWAAIATDVTEVSAGIGSVLEALAFVEQSLIEQYPARGVIHMNRYAAILLDVALVREGGQLTTMLGTPVVAGGGYGAIGATSPANVTIYGTGPVVMRRGETQAQTVLDKATNKAITVAQRAYVVGWDCAAVGATATT